MYPDCITGFGNGFVGGFRREYSTLCNCLMNDLLLLISLISAVKSVTSSSIFLILLFDVYYFFIWNWENLFKNAFDHGRVARISLQAQAFWDSETL